MIAQQKARDEGKSDFAESSFCQFPASQDFPINRLQFPLHNIATNENESNVERKLPENVNKNINLSS